MGVVVEFPGRRGGFYGLWTRRDVAARWGVSERTVGRYMDLGLPFVRCERSGAVRFDPAVVEGWMLRVRPRGAVLPPVPEYGPLGPVA